MNDLKIVNNSVQTEIPGMNTTTGGSTFIVPGGSTLGNTINTGSVWPYTYWYPYTNVPYNWVTVNKAENGFVVTKNGKTYVASTPEEIVNLLKDENVG